MEILKIVGGFLAIIVFLIAIVLIIIAIAKGKIKNPLASNGDNKTKTTVTATKKSFPWKTIIFLIIVFGIGWFVYPYIPEYKHERYQAPSHISPWNSMDVCPGAKHDFSHEQLPMQKEIEFKKNCAVQVVLPPFVNFRIDPTVNMEIIFRDNAKFIDGPNKTPDYGKGIKRNIFRARGLEESGILKISAEKARE